MKFLGNILGTLILMMCFVFVFKGDALLSAMADKYKAAGEACLADPDCYMTFNDYEDYLWAYHYE